MGKVCKVQSHNPAYIQTGNKDGCKTSSQILPNYRPSAQHLSAYLPSYLSYPTLGSYLT